MKVALGTDHRGFELKQHIKKFLEEKNYQIEDFGSHGPESVDYPDFGFPAAEAVAIGECDRAILFCSSGIGMSIAANKVRGIRAALCLTEEMSKLAREHNHANVLVLASEYTDKETAEKIVEKFFTTGEFGERHARRVKKVNQYRS